MKVRLIDENGNTIHQEAFSTWGEAHQVFMEPFPHFSKEVLRQSHEIHCVDFLGEGIRMILSHKDDAWMWEGDDE